MQVLENLGNGGFSRVDKVIDANGRLVARKTLVPSEAILRQTSAEKLRKRFKREVMTQRELPSEWFLPVLEEDLEADPPWFTMPLAEKNLQQEISELQLEPEKLTEALSHVLIGLDILHDLGFVHRDLKPQNVLFHDGQWKLSDFGLAAPPVEATTLLTTNSTWGSAPYCPPEQTVNFHSVSAAGDIYAFGCILHDIYGESKRVPYAEQTAPGAVGAIIERCTRKEPRRRFESIAALRAALLTAIQSPVEHEPSADASTWVQKMAIETAEWDSRDIRRFRGFVVGLEPGDDLDSIMTASSESFMERLRQWDPDVWEEFVWNYCEWARESSFPFAYCDVVAPRLSFIAGRGALALSANAIIAAATMAATHNRFFAMATVRALAGNSMDEKLAARLAIEIKATEAEEHFSACSRNENVEFHPRVREAIG